MLKWFILPCKMPAPAAQLNQGITELSWFTFRIVIIPLIGKKKPLSIAPCFRNTQRALTFGFKWKF